MKGRCFDIEGNRWKTITPFTGTSTKVNWFGFTACTGVLQEAGWELNLVKNIFTGRSKLLMRNSALQLVASGELNGEFCCIIRHMTPEKVKGLSRIRLPNETVDFSDLEVIDVLNAVAEIQKSEAPKKPKTHAEIISLREYA